MKYNSLKKKKKLIKKFYFKKSSGSRITFYKDVPLILHSLKDHGIKIGIASRTGAISW